MSEKKTSANWYIATTHYLTAGLVVPFIGSIILAFVFRSLNISDLPRGLIGLIASPIIVYLGVMYAARYVNRTYVFNDPMKIVRLSTIYLAILSLGFLAASTAFVISRGIEFDPIPLLITLMTDLIDIPVFYIASKKYIARSA